MTSLAWRCSTAQRSLDCSAVIGLVFCVLIAALAPHFEFLQPHCSEMSIDAQQLGTIPQSIASAVFGKENAPSRRDNATLEAALEAAVMGAFLADAASLGLHGCAWTRTGI